VPVENVCKHPAEKGNISNPDISNPELCYLKPRTLLSQTPIWISQTPTVSISNPDFSISNPDKDISNPDGNISNPDAHVIVLSH
jgi:hypothetical protein